MARLAQAVLDGLRLRCPACRAGRMSPRWWTVTRLHARCPDCDIPFLPGRGEEGGGVEGTIYVTVLVGMVGVMLLVVAEASWWMLGAWVGAWGIVAPLLTYRHFRGAWVGTMWGLATWPQDGDPPRVTPGAWPWDD